MRAVQNNSNLAHLGIRDDPYGIDGSIALYQAIVVRQLQTWSVVPIQFEWIWIFVQYRNEKRNKKQKPVLVYIPARISNRLS